MTTMAATNNTTMNFSNTLGGLQGKEVEVVCQASSAPPTTRRNKIAKTKRGIKPPFFLPPSLRTVDLSKYQADKPPFEYLMHKEQQLSEGRGKSSEE